MLPVENKQIGGRKEIAHSGVLQRVTEGSYLFLCKGVGIPSAVERAAPSSPAGWAHAWNAQYDQQARGTGSRGNWLHRAGRPGQGRLPPHSRAAIARCRTAPCR